MIKVQVRKAVNFFKLDELPNSAEKLHITQLSGYVNGIQMIFSKRLN